MSRPVVKAPLNRDYGGRGERIRIYSLGRKAEREKKNSNPQQFKVSPKTTCLNLPSIPHACVCLALASSRSSCKSPGRLPCCHCVPGPAFSVKHQPTSSPRKKAHLLSRSTLSSGTKQVNFFTLVSNVNQMFYNGNLYSFYHFFFYSNPPL